MELVNLLEIKSNHGYRKFKLYHGDISDLTFQVDLVCVSAFKNGYNPVPRTLIGSLYEKKNIDLKNLASNPEIDLRPSENCFITKNIDDTYIKRILCLEMIGSNLNLENNLNNLLSTLYKAELAGIKISSIMFPLLGTGNQAIEPNSIVEVLLRKIEYLLTTSININEVNLVEINKDKCELLNKSMNQVLGRVSNIFKTSNIIKTVIGNIQFLFNNHRTILNERSFNDLQIELEKESIDTTLLSVYSRNICEFILADLFPNHQKKDLVFMITNLRELNIPPWIESYFHMLRVFGNAYVHEKLKARTPKEVSESDLIIVLFGLERVIEFYVTQKNQHKS